jgi:ATP/maltotriose-dependent transcriptional regulator MalT
MTGLGGTPAGRRMATGGSVDSFLEAKLHWPLPRERWVERARLLDLLDSAASCQVILVAAPAGYGKSTLVAQWLASARRTPAAAWVSLDSGDNDPGRLWTHIATALERAGCVVADDLAAFMSANSDNVVTSVLPRIVNALADMREDIVILLDDFHFVQDSACHDQVEFFIEHLPRQAHLLISTRADPGLRLGRVRATGGLAEIRADDLAFNECETANLLAMEGVQLSSDAVAQLMLRTEGWPAGLYLAALSLSGRPDPEEFVRRFSGGNRFIGDYLTEEVLSRHTDRTREFITSTSVLDRFCAPLCDFIAETTGSAGILHELERTNLFLVPLDDERRWFRFHHLFAAVARTELETEHPDLVPSLHSRAAQWFRDHGHIDEAVTQYLAAGNTGDAALLVQANWLLHVDSGRMSTVLGWLDALGTPSIATDPAAGVTAAWMAALSGDERALNEHLHALEEFHDYGPLPDGTRSVESAVALIGGVFGFDGPVEMLAGAHRAVELETDGRSPYYAIANMSLGHCAYVAGDLDLAANFLAKAWHNDAAPVLIRVLGLSIQSLVEFERGYQGRGREFAERAMQLVDDNGMHAMHQTSMAFTALGQAQAAAGNVTEAMATLDRGLAMRRKNPALSPWQTIHHLLVMARIAVDAGQVSLAQELLLEAAKRMDRYHDGMGPMRARLAAIQAVVRSRTAAATIGEPLTGREFDVLRLLQGTMSLNQIAAELYLSPNTVKTHTKALYRKLGAGSRSDAVQVARQRLLI